MLCVIRKGFMSWSSSRPLSGKTGIVSNIYDKPPTQRLESQSRKTSPPLLPSVQATYRRLSRILAKRDVQSVDLSPRKISSFLRPVKEDLGLRT
jgi:NH3-dependent NAD+ synthetase